MKKKLLFLLVPLLIGGLSGCVKYNGRNRNSNKSSSNPDASDVSSASDLSGDSTDASLPPEGSSDNSDSSAIPGSSSDASSASSGDSSIPSSTSSQDSTPQPSSGELPVGTDVKVYLVFGEYGLYKNNPVNTNVDALFLEHTLELDAKVGDRLPTRDDVTSTVSGSKFVAWTSYNNDGKITTYTKVPGVDKKVLYASFSGGSGTPSSSSSAPQSSGSSSQGGGGSSSSSQPPIPSSYTPSTSGALPASGYGFKFLDGTYMAASATSQESPTGHVQYLIEKRAFTKDQEFQLYDFGNNAGWTVDIDGYSFGGDSSDSQNWTTYLAKDYGKNAYRVLQDFNCDQIYIKLKYGEDQLYFSLAS